MIYVCSCGWKVDPSGPGACLTRQGFAALHLGDALRHWMDGHRISAAADVVPLVEQKSIEYARRAGFV